MTKNFGLKNPLGAAALAAALKHDLEEAGVIVHTSSDMKLFDQVKREARGFAAAPMHHYATGMFDHERAFWMSVTDASGKVVGLQALRFDLVDTNLADWCINYMIGVYMRHQELMIPAHVHAPTGSIAERLTGRLVYHGEMWLDPQVRNHGIFENFCRLGIIIALIKWQPDAIWGLANAQMATRGHFTRAGFTVVERGFMRWQWATEGIDPVEYLVAVEGHSLESMVEEFQTTRV
jgi:hypothetical protein